MKTLQYLVVIILLSTTINAQSLKGGNKNFGTLSYDLYYWFFSQDIKSNPLNRNKYEKVFYQTIYMDKDYNNDGIKDKGDWHIKTNNDITKDYLDYLLVTVPTVNNFKGTEIEIYSDCYDCVSLYRNGTYGNISNYNIFYRMSNVIPTDGTSVRTISSLPLLFQIPQKYSNKNSFTFEVGYKIKTAKKKSCNFNEYSVYNYYNTTGDYNKSVNNSDATWLVNDSYCHTTLSDTSTKTYKFNWGNEEEFDSYIIVYTIQY